jgi:hypothetical protein
MPTKYHLENLTKKIKTIINDDDEIYLMLLSIEICTTKLTKECTTFNETF